jgi:exopolysaccharide production protein ExoF
MVAGPDQVVRTCSFHRAVYIATVERLGPIVGLAVVLIAAFVSVALAGSDSPLASGSYPLATGDRLDIAVFGEPDLSGEAEVDNVGSISLPLIGRVQVTGLDAGALEAIIVEKLMDYLKNPRVTVEVLAYRPFYILGGVKLPGRYPYVVGMTVLNAIALSGGYYVTEENELRTRLAVTQGRENLNLLRGDYRVAIIREARLLAERDGLEEIAFPQEVLQNQNDPKVIEQIDGETRILTTRRESLNGAIAILMKTVSEYREEISALKTQMRSDAEQIKLLKIEIEGLERLLEKGFARKPRILQMRRTLSEVEGRLRGRQAFIARAQQSIGGAELEIIKLRQDWHSDVVAQLQQVQNEISKLANRLVAATDVLRENSAAATRTRTQLLDQTSSRIIITRNTADGPRDLEATEHTPVFPGDVIRIPGSLASPLTWSPMSTGADTMTP